MLERDPFPSLEDLIASPNASESHEPQSSSKDRKTFQTLSMALVLIFLFAITRKIYIENQTDVIIDRAVAYLNLKPSEPDAEILLQATARAVEIMNLPEYYQTSFVAEGNFTHDVFEQLRPSVFRLTSEIGLMPQGAGHGTGWLLKNEGRYLYLVTSRHVATEMTGGMRLSQPATSNLRLEFDDSQYMWVAANSGQDLAIIVVVLSSMQQALTRELPALEFTPTYPEIDTPLLTIGYPSYLGEVDDNGQDQPYLYANVAPLSRYADMIYQPIAPGASGSPVIRLSESGQAQVVGTIDRKSTPADPPALAGYINYAMFVPNGEVLSELLAQAEKLVHGA